VSVRAEIFLGVIAVAMLAIAVVQVGVLVAAGRLARRVDRLMDEVERELKPLFAQLQAIGRDASRAAALATAQVERADRLFADIAARVDQVLTSVQKAVSTPAREGRALVGAFRAAMTAIRDIRANARRRAREDEDALFI
jgi:uncharacterized protein YoxC